MFSHLTNSPNTFSQSILYGTPESPLPGLSDYHFRFSTSLSLPPFNWPTHNTFSQSILYGIPKSPLSGLAKDPPPPPRCWPGSLECSLSRTLARQFHLVHASHPVRHPPPLGSRCATWFGSVRISCGLEFSFLVLTIPPPLLLTNP